MPTPAQMPPDFLERPVTAALRAGYAWSVRHRNPKAWREVARMTGVIMRAFGPERGPVTPAELIPLLHKPLGEWLPGAAEDEALAKLAVLDDNDVLTDATFEVGCDYTIELLAGQVDPGEGWLPSWRVHRAEQVEHATFEALLSGNDQEYTFGRRFLIENAAGDKTQIWRSQTELGLPPLARFDEIPHDRQWRGWWWSCPVCQWPMRVQAGRVGCSFPRHDAAYILLPFSKGAPRLQPMEGTRRVVAAKSVDKAVCVDESVWRYIVVPGVVEVRLCDRINALAGVRACLYPEKDRYDIHVQPDNVATGESPPWEFTLDVKDYASASALAHKLTANPVMAEYVVIPRYRKNQRQELQRLLPYVKITTEDRVYAQVKRAAARHGGAK